ncbi:MAG: hypothetical protein ABSE73_26410, partial [Planctomycetota bacterium]
MAKLAKDLEAHKSDANVTFVGINTTVGANEKRIRAEVDEFNLKPFAHVLDSTGMISSAYGVSWKVLLTVVMLDAEGKVVGKRSLDGSLPEAKGILADVKIPSGAEKAAYLFSQQQFNLMEQELAKLPPGAEIKGFREALKKKIEDYTKKRVPELAAAADANPLNVYHEALAFVKAFPGAKEAGAAQSLANKLAGKPEVKKEVEAEQMYHQVVAPELAK